MHICSNCKERISVEQPESSRSFPAYSVISGILGTIGATITGTLLVVPAAIVAGALVDTATRRCGVCGTEIKQDQPTYRLMAEVGDERGGQIYRPISQPNNTQRMTPRQSGLRQFNQGLPQEPSQINLADTSREADNQPTQYEFIFDEIEGKLVQRDLSGGQNEADIDIDLAGDFSNSVDAGSDTQYFDGLPDHIETTDNNCFPGLEDNTEPDNNLFGLIDEPPVGEL